METMRCKKHPNFNPHDKFKRNFDKECEVCCNLQHGAKRIGHFGGEFTVNVNDIDKAKTKIGPLNFEQFGYVRFSLGWDYHFEDTTPSWYIDEKTMTIYINERLDDKKIREFKKMKCKIMVREWTESEI